MVFEYHFIKDYYFAKNGLNQSGNKLLYWLGILRFVVVKEKETEGTYWVEERYHRFNPFLFLIGVLALPLIIIREIVDGVALWFQGIFVETKKPFRYGEISKQDVYYYYFPNNNKINKENNNDNTPKV